jgi:hypothetical protein
MELAAPMTSPLATMMADKGPVWQRIIERHGLTPVPFDKVAAWSFGDYVFGRAGDAIFSTTRIRQAGFHDIVDSEAMFLRLFDEFRTRKVIP